MSDDPFESSKFSIAWAKDHIAELDRHLDIFLNDKDTHATVTERNADGTYDLLKFKLCKPMPRPIRGHATDTIYNLRAALDQAMYAVVGDFQYFPIRNDKTAFDAAMVKISQILPNDICAAIGNAKPYKGGDDLFWALKELSNTNKHATIRPAAFFNSRMELKGTHTGRPAQFPFPPRWDSTKNEIILARIPVTDGKIEMNFDYSFFIAFDEVEIVSETDIVSALNNMARAVASVVTAIEAESKRIGLF